ncbi:MAG: phosphoglycerate kinase [Candidatus Nanohaloarchaea archaeon]|nr:phosphoglycerate kinase [Candidatus Nanohaloarchaea archaeon]
MKPWKDQDLSNRRVLLRTDLNLPVEGGRPQKTLRFERYMETVDELSGRDAKTVVMTHQGRPGREDFVSLENHAEMMSQHLGGEVKFIPSFFGPEAEEKIEALDSGDVALMENTRFLSEELRNRGPEEHAKNHFVRKLSKKFDTFVNDAFSAAHRSHGSLVGFNQHLESLAGPVMMEEVENCRDIRENLEEPLLVLGGEKPGDIADIMDNMAGRARKVLLGGVPGELAVMADGNDIGGKREWVEKRGMDKHLEKFKELLDQYREKIVVPEDFQTDKGIHEAGDIPEKAFTWDIGNRTEEKFCQDIRDSDSLLMKGAMGAFDRGFENGTRKVMDEVADSDGFTVLGGGHTSSLVGRYGLSIGEFSHVSIAGGAFVRFISGEELPVIDALKQY